MAKYRQPTEFDYDLFKNSEGKFFTRVKRTGEVTEVSIEVFRVLRNEAMRMYREQKGIPIYGEHNGKSVVREYKTILMLDTCEHEENAGTRWLVDGVDFEENIMAEIALEEFKKLLTKKQLEVLNNCLLLGASNREYARLKGVNEAAVRKSVNQIRKKAKIFFSEGTQ